MNAVATSVIVLAYGAEPYLGDCIVALLGDAGTETQVIVVDNGARDAVAALPGDARVEIVTAKRNLGFAGGCNEGVRHARGDVLVFVNSDAIVARGAVSRLTAALDDPAVGLASGSLRMADDPGQMNSAGNPVHYLGFGWAGGFGEPADAHMTRREVTSVTGAFFAIRRCDWDVLGGFADEFFAYHEDIELSLRAWQRGWTVVFEPSAVALHHYEFGRSALKQYLVERNRWITVLTVFPTPVLAAALPVALACEVPLTVLAVTQGWLSQKLTVWQWLFVHRAWITQRRAAVQKANRLPAGEFAGLLSARLSASAPVRPPALGALNALLSSYWRLARLLLRAEPPGPADPRAVVERAVALPVGGR